MAIERIGLFGGSFDPVHLGHLMVVQAALEELQLDRLYLIPAARSPFKPDSSPAPALLRARMLRMVMQGWTRVRVDLQEIERGGVSFTVDTLKQYSKTFPDAGLYYLIGSDHVSSLPKWKDSSDMASLAEFVVIPRPGEIREEAPQPFRVRWLKGWPTVAASSEIRKRVNQGLPISHLVPWSIVNVIRDHQLYL